MNLVWKLLRHHISVSNFVGFSLANLVGMCIVLLSFQFYKDVMPLFTGDDALLKTNGIVVSKRVGMGSTLSGRTNGFTASEVDDLRARPFARRVGLFTPANYMAEARMSFNGAEILGTELFFESIPDEFVDMDRKTWRYAPGEAEVPIILPRSYITMYNFGFAQGRALPRLSDGLMGMVTLDITLRGNGHQGRFKGRVVKFSNRMTAILVPQAFMDWSNAHFAPDGDREPTRLVMEIENPGSETVVKYFDKHGYEVENNQLETEKHTYFLKTTVGVVMVVGGIISVLSFYILMLSIYLLVQKNATKLQNLLLIGYSPARVARPYQVLTIVLNGAVLMVAWCVLFFLRLDYMEFIETFFPDWRGGTMMPSILLGAVLLIAVSICNIWVIRQKIMKIWKNKE